MALDWCTCYVCERERLLAEIARLVEDAARAERDYAILDEDLDACEAARVKLAAENTRLRAALEVR